MVSGEFGGLNFCLEATELAPGRFLGTDSALQ